MFLLDPCHYDKVIKPLKNLTINTLYAQTVVEQKITGTVYVDNPDMPKTFHIYHPYGMSLLFGETVNDDFNTRFLDYALNIFKVREKYEWLQAYPDEWSEKLTVLFGENLIKAKDNTGNDKDKLIEENTRVNFKFNKEKYLDFKNTIQNNGYKILPTDKQMFEDMNGSVVPKYFWKDAEQFHNQGVGFSLFHENKLASTAFASFIHGKQLEIGIESDEKHRGKGFAIFTCSALIDYCIDHNYEPIWSCRLENIGSYLLAQKLGFEPIRYSPYYRLIK